MVRLRYLLILCALLGIGYYTLILRKKNILSQKGKLNRLITLIISSIVLTIFIASVSPSANKEKEIVKDKVEKTAKKESKTEEKSKTKYIKLDVPLINQKDEPMLYNGCEVTSLAMLFNYYGIDKTKSELAEKIDKEPFQHEDGTYGDPNKGFVGSVYGEPGESGRGYGVYIDPILKLSKEEIPQNYRVINLSNTSFDDLLLEMSEGRPIWCITTTSLSATNDMETWETKNGKVDISWSIHSVVLTGFDDENIFVNDPYGEKKEVSKKEFMGSWKQMGSQAMTIKKIE